MTQPRHHDFIRESLHDTFGPGADHLRLDRAEVTREALTSGGWTDDGHGRFMPPYSIDKEPQDD